MPIKPKIEVTQGFPSCANVKLCDVTLDYNNTKSSPDYSPYGYGFPNIAKADITSTKIYVMPPGADAFKEIVTEYIPEDGCVTLTATDLINSESEEIITTNCCGCETTPTTETIGSWSDGCWKWKYEIYAAGNCYSYDLSAVDFPNAFRVTVNSLVYDLGYCTSVSDLVIKLSALNFCSFTATGTTIEACTTYTFGDIEWSNTTFDLTLDTVAYPRQEIAYINSTMYNMGSVTSLANHIAILNALGLGYWSSSVVEFIVYGFSNYGFQSNGYAYYDNAVFTYSAASSSIIIDGATYTLGAVGSVTELVSKLNLLNLGLFIYDSGSDQIQCTSPFVLTDLTVGATTNTNPDGGLWGLNSPTTDSDVVSPVITASDDVLVGTTTVDKFFHCNISKEVSAMLLEAFTDDCACDDVDRDKMTMQMYVEYETLLIATKENGCDCDCNQDYMTILQAQINKLKNNC